MIPCYGTQGSRQWINNKSIQEEYKFWVLVAERYGYVVQFRPYQGAKKGKQVASSAKRGLDHNKTILCSAATHAPIFNARRQTFFV